jgi:ferric-chelate reductase [NAD(P)H]
MNEKTLHKISYGLYIISSKRNGKFNGQIANTVFQTTADPPIMAVCINKKNLTHEFIKKSNVFTISILSKETPMRFIGQFGFKSGRDLDKFKDINYEIGITGAPIVLDNTVGYIECEVVNSMDAKSHTIFIGKVLDAEILKDGEPMTYAYYHEVKGGKSPKTAPTYIKRIETENEKKKKISLKEKIGKKIKKGGKNG